MDVNDGEPSVLGGERVRLEVALLGPPSVCFGDVAFTYQQQSLISYLAVQGPASGEDLADALWGGRAMSPSRLSNLLAELRSMVGRTTLPRCEDGYYRLANVDCDIDRLEHLAVSGEMESQSTGRLVAIGVALGGVRGLPLHRSARAGRAFWGWLENCFVERACIERNVTALALEASQRFGSGRPGHAIWAVEQGLLAAPGEQLLVQRLVELYEHVGLSHAARTVTVNWNRLYGEIEYAGRAGR